MATIWKSCWHNIAAASAGNFNCTVQGPMDKGNVLEDILLSMAAASGDGSVPCVYVGDSIGDLAALLAAHVPIVLGNNAMLRHALNTFGCTLHALSDAALVAGDHPAGARSACFPHRARLCCLC